MSIHQINTEFYSSFQAFTRIFDVRSLSKVLFNYLDKPKQEEQSIAELLINQVQCTVRMQDCIEYLIKDDVKTFIEIGPGKVLSGFVKKILKAMGRNADEYSIFTIENIEDLQANPIKK